MRLFDFKPILEGGAATKLPSIALIDIEPTIKKIAEYLSIPREDIHLIGSTGKKPISGDIDIAIDSSRYNTELIDKKMKEISNNNSHFNKGFNVGSYSFPVRGEEELGRVQVDIMYTPDPVWSKFFWHGPAPQESKYTGAIRGILLRAVAGTLNTPGIDWILYNKQGEIIARAGRSISPLKGLSTLYKYRKELKPGQYSKTEYSTEPEEFQRMFPTAKFKPSLERDPLTVAQAIFGKDITLQQVLTTESVIKLIKQRFDQTTQQLIFKKTADQVKDLVKKGYQLPKEIAEYINESRIIEKAIKKEKVTKMTAKKQKPNTKHFAWVSPEEGQNQLIQNLWTVANADAT